MNEKIGRNSLCTCGSGKKFKKCCLGTPASPVKPIEHDRHYFDLKGKKAEEVIHQLAAQSFLTDWCFANPRFPNGKEICDLLVVYDAIAIIWQIKDLKLDNSGQYKIAEVNKNLRQLLGARRRLFDLKAPVTLQNARRQPELFDPSTIKSVYLVSAMMGEHEDLSELMHEANGHYVHRVSREDAQIILSELDTISDFTKYLIEKEKLFAQNTSIQIVGSEKELLAWYMQNGNGFDEFREVAGLVIEDGIWEHFITKEGYKNKKQADRVSYAWDSIIDRAHEGSAEYERVARELARPNRFERRVLAKQFGDGWMTAHEKRGAANNYRRVCPTPTATYCFVFDDDRERRKAILHALCWIARDRYAAHKVIGIATEQTMSGICASDFAVMYLPEWGDDEHREAVRLSTELDLLQDPLVTRFSATEYPSDETDPYRFPSEG